MNKALATTVSAFLAVSASYVHGFETWLGAKGVSRINTGLDNGTETSGYWFSRGDDADGGESRVSWNSPTDDELGIDALAPVIKDCGGVCGTAVLSQGTLTYQPYVTLEFNVAGETQDAVNASDWEGVCITYTSAAVPSLELGLGNFDSEIGFANPAVSLSKSAAGTSKFFKWSDFKQPDSYKGKTKISGEEAAEQLASIRFKIQAVPGSYKFNICAIGPYNGGECPTACGVESIKKNPTITEEPSAIENLVYNGKAQELIKAGKAEHGTFLYKHADAEEFNDALPSATEVGEYTIFFMVKGDEDYKDIGPISLTASISVPESSSSVIVSSSSIVPESSSSVIVSSSSSAPESSSSVIVSSSSSAPESSSSVIVSSSSSAPESSSSVIVSSSSSAPESSSSKASKQGFVSAMASSPIKMVLDHNELHISTQTASELKVNIFDVQGNLKMQYRGNAATSHLVSLKNLIQGMYLVQVTSGTKTQIHKVVIK